MSLSFDTPSQPALSAMAESVWSVLKPFSESSMVVALSGGVDSTVLLHLLAQLRDAGLVSSLTAVHVHHGLSDNADYWAEHCQRMCEYWQVPLIVERVDITTALGDGVEQAARTLRYNVFEQHLSENDCLLQGHHRNDQAETLLFRLFRGSGLDGLQGIPLHRPLGRGQLIRPMLRVSRREIEAYAAEQNLEHIEDESNLDQQFARNFLRQSLIPELEQRWPGLSERLATLADEVRESQQCQHILVEEAAERVLKPSPDYWNAGQVVDIEALQQLPEAMAGRVIRLWLKSKGLLMPDRQQLQTLFAEVVHCREDGEPRLQLGEHEVRRFNGLLVLIPVLDEFTQGPFSWNCHDQQRLKISGSGWLSLKPDTDNVPEELTICFRHTLPDIGKVRVAGRRGSKTIKRWLQDYRVPPWLRDRVPFLFYRGQMLGAAGVWQCDWTGQSGRGKPLDNAGIKVSAGWRFDPY